MQYKIYKDFFILIIFHMNVFLHVFLHNIVDEKVGDEGMIIIGEFKGNREINCKNKSNNMKNSISKNKEKGNRQEKKIFIPL